MENEPDEQTKRAVQNLSDAIQACVDANPAVKQAVANLERLGYIAKFKVRMDLDLQRPMADEQLTDTKVRLA